MPDYSHSKIYAIRAPGTDEVYIGSTTNKYLSVRLAQHRCAYKKFQEGVGHNRESFKMLEKAGHYIEFVEAVECGSIDELRKREGEVIRSTPNCINRYIAGRTNAEYRKEHIDKYRQIKRNYKAKQKAEQNQQGSQSPLGPSGPQVS